MPLSTTLACPNAVDTTPPSMALPSFDASFFEATSPAGAHVSFAATALDLVSQDVPVTCTPEGAGSNFTFPLGTTEVTCTATDAAGNSVTDSFNVTVCESANKQGLPVPCLLRLLGQRAGTSALAIGPSAMLGTQVQLPSAVLSSP